MIMKPSAKQSATDAFKTASKRTIEWDWVGNNWRFGLEIKLLTELQKPQNLLQMKKKILDLKEKYIQKDIYLWNKYWKLLMI